MQQVIAALLPLVFTQRQCFQNRHDVLFNRHFAKDRFLLWQIAYAQSRPLEHRESGHVLIAENDVSAVCPDEAYDYVESRCLPCTVRPEQAYYLSCLDVNID